MTARASAVSIFEALPDDAKRKWEAERGIIRNGIAKAKHMPRRDREAMMLLTNHWFYHRNSEGYIRPGAALLADKLECSIRTIKTVLKNLRDAGYLIPLDYEKGGRNATRYAVNLALIVENLCRQTRNNKAQHDEIKARNEAHINRAKSIVNRAKVARGIKGKSQTSEEPLPEAFGDPSDWVEVPF